MPSPVCSVLILARNSLEQLPNALSSVAMQRCRDIETIVVDDGSSDGTEAWLERLADDWSGFRFIQTGGIGPGRARNAGIELASSPVISFLDARDWWWPDKLKAQLGFHSEHPATAFSFTDYLQVSQEGEGRGTCFEHLQCPIRLCETTDYLRLDDYLGLQPSFVGVSTVLANKAALEAAGGFSAGASGDGTDLWIRMAAHSPIACSKSISASSLVGPESAAPLAKGPVHPGEQRAQPARKRGAAILLSSALHFIGGGRAK
jgi:glycosyltransferase involved in cell wall biosynthesis